MVIFRLALTAWNAGGWENSRVREALPDELREHMDSLDRAGLKAELRVMRDQAATSGWEATLQAVRLAYEATGVSANLKMTTFANVSRRMR